MSVMIYRVLLTTGLCFVLFHGRAGWDQQKDEPADTLQSLVDDYSHALKEKKGCIKRSDSLNAAFAGNKKRQNSLSDQKKRYEHLKDSIARLKWVDRHLKDSAALGVKLYDSLKTDVDKKLTRLEKEYKIAEKEITRYAGEVRSHTGAAESLLKKIRDFTHSLSGARRMTIDNKQYHLFVADMDLYDIRLHLFNKKGGKNYFTFGAVLNVLQEAKKEPLMITNAGMFTPQHEPEGLYVEEQAKYSFPIDTGSSVPVTNFYMKPNGVFFIDSADHFCVQQTEEFLLRKKNGLPAVKMATQSGPMLVLNGDIHPAFKPTSANLNIRSGVGVLTSKKVVFAIALTEVNFYDFASFFKDFFDCKNALYLDGAISQMYLRDIASGITSGRFGPIISVSKK